MMRAQFFFRSCNTDTSSFSKSAFSTYTVFGDSIKLKMYASVRSFAGLARSFGMLVITNVPPFIVFVIVLKPASTLAIVWFRSLAEVVASANHRLTLAMAATSVAAVLSTLCAAKHQLNPSGVASPKRCLVSSLNTSVTSFRQTVSLA